MNLGDDSDTVGAVAGSLAGLYDGIHAIPQEWIAKLAKKEWLELFMNEFIEKG